jgi:hypothetical protein
VCTSPPLPLPVLLVWAGGAEVDDLCGAEVGVVGVVGEGVGVGVSLPLPRAAFAGFDEDEGGAEGDVFAEES